VYAKVFTQIYDGTLCTRGPWQALVTFQQLLVLADPDGNVDMTAEAIARRTTIPLDIIEQGILALMLPDLESRTPTEDGRRIVLLSEGRSWGWHIVNYKHYRELKREEDRREYHREYWRTKRSKASTDSTRTQHAQPNQPKKETEAEAEAIPSSPSSKKEPARKRAASLPAPADVDAQVWDDWLQLRKAKRAPVTATVLDGARKEAAKASMTLEAFLRVWCRRGTQGLEAAWLRPDERSQPAEPAWRTEQRERMREALGPYAAGRRPVLDVPTEEAHAAPRLD
jgi:hypothetical protein